MSEGSSAWRHLGRGRARAAGDVLGQLSRVVVQGARRGVLASLALAATIGFGACDKGTQKVDTGPAGPPLHVVATYPASNTDSSSSVPTPLDAVLRIRFDRFLRPETAIRQSIRVTGGSIDADGGTPASAQNFSLEPVYDVVERVVTYRSDSPWLPGIRYTVTLWSPNDSPDGSGFVAWDDVPLASSVTFSFRTVDTAGGPPTEQVPRQFSYCDACAAGNTAAPNQQTWLPGAGSVLGGECGSSTCHGSIAGAPSGVAALDLSTASGIKSTAIGRPAHGSLTSPSSTESLAIEPLFGQGMPLIDPGNPGNSYILYKMLINTAAYADSGSCPADATCGGACSALLAPCACTQDGSSGTVPCSCAGFRWQCDGAQSFPANERVGGAIPADPADIDRLRARIFGGPMPYGTDATGASTGAAIPLAAVKIIQSWIASGAPVADTCADGASSQSVCDAIGGTTVFGTGAGDGLNDLDGGLPVDASTDLIATQDRSVKRLVGHATCRLRMSP